MSFGITPEGFVPKTYSDVVAEIEDGFRAKYGDSVDLDPRHPVGQFIGIMAERLAELWEVAEAVDAAHDPDKATGESLVAVCALTGTLPQAATPSTVVLTATGSPGTPLPSGRVVSVVVVGTKFETTALATIAAVASWVASTAYLVGDRVTLGSKVYVCVDPGTSAGSGGPTGTTAGIVDGGVIWDYVGDGTGCVDVNAVSQDAGPKIALSGTLSVIETPVSGWQNVRNLLDATLGLEADTDASLRTRREVELTSASDSSLEALRSAVLRVPGVTTAHVFQNVTAVTDADGVPPKAVEVLVLGGDDNDIREAIFGHIAAGIQSYGTTSGTVTDSEGVAQSVAFTRPTLRTIYVSITLVKDPLEYPTDGDAQVKQAIVDYGDTYPIGRNVTSSAMAAQAFKIGGVLDITSCFVGLVPSPTLPDPVSVSTRQLAVFDTSRVVVTSSDGTP
jgi:uncharacterized phage protein gp47/JayE